MNNTGRSIEPACSCPCGDLRIVAIACRICYLVKGGRREKDDRLLLSEHVSCPDVQVEQSWGGHWHEMEKDENESLHHKVPASPFPKTPAANAGARPIEAAAAQLEQRTTVTPPTNSSASLAIKRNHQHTHNQYHDRSRVQRMSE